MKQSSRVVEKVDSAEKLALIRAAAECGVKITAKQINRWRADQLVPEADRVSRGSGRGVARPAAPGTLEQIVALANVLSKQRSLDLAAICLWLQGFEIPIERVRRALRAKSPRAVLRKSKSEVSAAAETLQEKLIRRPRVPKRVRELAEGSSMNQLFKVMVDAIVGEASPPEELQAASTTFEDAFGVRRARTDRLPDNSAPWLPGPVAVEPLAEALRSVQDLFRSEDATDAELLQARTTYKNWQEIVAFSCLVQNLYGEGAFGFGAFTERWLGESDAEHAHLMFVVMIAATRTKPETSTVFANLAKTARESHESIQRTIDAQLVELRKS